ncbi:MAG: response regulator transcription factor [Clostridia bacterium]|nr:response regulator transcription factor [Clostridia bacterium]
MARILIVDDEPQIRDIVCKYAAFSGYRAEEAENGMIAVEKCRRERFDAVIMDIMMPELDGFSAVREIRKFSSVPIIMLSARSEDYDKISGFELGADDYVEKPFSPKILMLRVAAILKRSGASDGIGDSAEIYRIDGLCVDISARIVTVDGVRAEMSPKEYDLLFFMIRNRGLALSREKLITSVWGYDYYGDDRTLDTHIKLLRRSLGRYSDLIVTLRGVGYRFEAGKQS